MALAGGDGGLADVESGGGQGRQDGVLEDQR